MNRRSQRISRNAAPGADLRAPAETCAHSNREVISLATGSRQRILEAAANLFERKGYASTSVREIAEASAITKPTLYYHFGNKKGLDQTLLDECGVRVGQVVEEASRVEGTPWTRIEYFCHGLALLMHRDPFVRQLVGASHFGASPDIPLDDAIHIQAKDMATLNRILAIYLLTQ